MTSPARTDRSVAPDLSPVGAATAFAAVLHAAQWGAIRAWVDAVPPAVLTRPSTLPGWSIDALLSHLATSVEAVGALRPVEGQDTAPPLGVSAYLTGYAQRSAHIQQRSVHAAAARTDRAGELDDAWAAAGPALLALGPRDRRVQAPGGMIRVSDFLLTRLIELVVHGLDLRLSVRALEGAGPVPEPLVLPIAVSRVAAVLRELCVQKRAAQHDAADVASAGDAGSSGGFVEVFGAELHDVRLVLLATGRDTDLTELGDALRSVLPLF